jgi:hypothetical protein
MNEGLLPNRILTPVGWDQPEPFTYLWNIILQGYFQMYPVPFGTSPISGAPRF